MTSTSDVKLPTEFEELLVKPLEIYDGENWRTMFNKMRRKVDKLIANHNKLVVAACHAAPTKPQVDRPLRWLNKPADVVDLLIQMRHTCECVAPSVTWLQLITSKYLWCKDCNRPYLEKDND